MRFPHIWGWRIAAPLTMILGGHGSPARLDPRTTERYVPQNVLQRDRALALANEKRIALARDKRRLKSGEMTFLDAYALDRWQNQSALELIGYCIVGHGYRGGQPTKPGQTALAIARDMQLSHFCVVGGLSVARADQIAAAISECGRAAVRRSAAASAAS